MIYIAPLTIFHLLGYCSSRKYCTKFREISKNNFFTEHVARLLLQKIKFSFKDIFRKCNQIRRKMRTWSDLLKKSLLENFIFCAVEILELEFAN